MHQCYLRFVILVSDVVEDSAYHVPHIAVLVHIVLTYNDKQWPMSIHFVLLFCSFIRVRVHSDGIRERSIPAPRIHDIKSSWAFSSLQISLCKTRVTRE